MTSARLRAVFAGTAEFSVPALQATAEHCDLVATITQPDRPGSRGKPAPRPVADAAAAMGVPILHPEKIRDPAAVDEILGLGADILVVAAYGQILPVRLLDGFRLGGVNVHASVLPTWRGAAPINAAILHGDDETGVSIMRMEAGLDTGPVYDIRRLPLDDTITAPVLTVALAQLGADALGDVLDQLATGPLEAVRQDDELATYAPRLTRDDGRVDWAVRRADDVARMVRALQPWPGVSAPLGGQEVRLLAVRADLSEADGTPGAVVGFDGDDVHVVAAQRSLLVVEQVQPAGGRPMSAAAYLRGRRSAV